MVNVLLVMTLLLIMAGIAWGLETQDAYNQPSAVSRQRSVGDNQASPISGQHRNSDTYSR
jgi:hypothetical protein